VVEHPLPARRTHPGAPIRVVEQRLDRVGELADVARLDQVGAVAVLADDLGDRPRACRSPA
jgi:hypothetical protein